MKRATVEDYLEKGMYGPKDTKPEERKKFLGTLRERVIVALTKSQVMEPGVYPELIQCMKEHPSAILLLNGELNYSFLSDYVKAARAQNISYSIVSNKEFRTNIGLVLAYPYAIDKEHIYIAKKSKEALKQPKKKKRFFLSLIKKWLRRRS
ncbi:uncharacterized protein YueI [Bacillus thermophilus]|uniref:Uncharacterized protein YueI n=1 Tax=Siminovitchia thermophila TaxID=1245522 RepID=A0ABS2R258_9BACI|nr:YueI family protein [Siminovitchia thermophila]MBM7713733.1 uncharacterized protein YueI [Siminovitchia thermophila]ONK21815.1 hypothetical protein BLX87_18025 [Bacillus sp. VT-16-64]